VLCVAEEVSLHRDCLPVVCLSAGPLCPVRDYKTHREQRLSINLPSLKRATLSAAASQRRDGIAAKSSWDAQNQR
jgi:hypothetical protein